MAKQGYAAYQDSQGQGQGQTNPGNNQAGGDFGVTGGSLFNAPANGHSGGMPFDLNTAQQHASQENGNKDSDLFSSAVGFLKKRMQDNDPKDDVDENKAQKAHETAYNQQQAGSMDARSMGAAAAMQAFKSFTSGGASGQSQGGGDFQSKLIGCDTATLGTEVSIFLTYVPASSMAMKEASSLFEKSGGPSDNGGKQDVITRYVAISLVRRRLSN